MERALSGTKYCAGSVSPKTIGTAPTPPRSSHFPTISTPYSFVLDSSNSRSSHNSSLEFSADSQSTVLITGSEEVQTQNAAWDIMDSLMSLLDEAIMQWKAEPFISFTGFGDLGCDAIECDSGARHEHDSAVFSRKVIRSLQPVSSSSITGTANDTAVDEEAESSRSCLSTIPSRCPSLHTSSTQTSSSLHDGESSGHRSAKNECEHRRREEQEKEYMAQQRFTSTSTVNEKNESNIGGIMDRFFASLHSPFSPPPPPLCATYPHLQAPSDQQHSQGASYTEPHPSTLILDWDGTSHARLSYHRETTTDDAFAKGEDLVSETDVSWGVARTVSIEPARPREVILQRKNTRWNAWAGRSVRKVDVSPSFSASTSSSWGGTQALKSAVLVTEFDLGLTLQNQVRKRKGVSRWRNVGSKLKRVGGKLFRKTRVESFGS